jgi:predicted permease
MILRDLRFAFRQLTKSPGFALAVVATLALGIGVNTAVFSMVDAFLLRSLPFRDPDRVAALILHTQGVSARSGTFVSEEDDSHTGEDWQTLKDSLRSVELAAWGGSDGVNLQTSATEGNAVQYVHEARVSADYFKVLDIPLFRGRSFSADEDLPSGPKAAILSYGLWRSTFQGDPAVVGKPVRLKGESYTVVGVLPQGAVVPSKADLYTALQPTPTGGECGGNNCGILMRLRPGATWQEVDAELRHVHLHAMDEFSGRKNGGAWLYAQPLARYLGGDMRPRVEVLMLAVSFILIIACANLAGLALVRIARRTREIATRLALGATRLEVLRQLWVESLVLALLGAGAGLGLGIAILRGLEGFLPDEMLPMGGFSLDARVLGFTLAASLVTSLLFGVLPALTTRRVDLRSSMSGGGYSVAGGSGGVRQWLIGAEVALTVVLLVSAGLLVRTLIHLETLPSGFDAHNVMTAKASLDDARYHEAPAFHSLLEKSMAAMRRIPGVEEVSVASSVPYERGVYDGIRIVDGPQAGTRSGSSFSYVTPGYFSTLRIPLLAGRLVSESDAAGSQPVVVVNEDFAEKYFHEKAPIGRHMRFVSDETAYTIVGVVGNVAKRPAMESPAPIAEVPIFYMPIAQTPQSLINITSIWFEPSWIVRTAGPVTGLTEAMQKAMAEADPGLPFSGFYSMDQILGGELRQQRMEVLLFASLAGLALTLSAIGIYALVSNLVVQRTREIGIRIALGSTVGRAMRQVGASGVLAAGFGLVAGVGFSLFAVRVLSSEIYRVRTYDPVTFVAVPVLLAVIALAASFLPTLRISRIEPAETLRSE